MHPALSPIHHGKHHLLPFVFKQNLPFPTYNSLHHCLGSSSTRTPAPTLRQTASNMDRSLDEIISERPVRIRCCPWTISTNTHTFPAAWWRPQIRQARSSSPRPAQRRRSPRRRQKGTKANIHSTSIPPRANPNDQAGALPSSSPLNRYPTRPRVRHLSAPAHHLHAIRALRYRPAAAEFENERELTPTSGIAEPTR